MTTLLENYGGQALGDILHGNGLRNMRERVAKLPDGELSLKPTEFGAELCLNFSVPVETSA